MKINRYEILLLFWPVFDLLGISVGGTSFRFAEIYIGIYSLLNFSEAIRQWRAAIKLNGQSRIVLALVLNLLLTFLVAVQHLPSINVAFFVKYLARNLLYIVFLLSCLVAGEKFEEKDICFLSKWTVALSTLCLALQLLTGKQLYMNRLITPQGLRISVFGFSMVRFSATTFEPGLAILILSVPLFYFTRAYQKNKLFFWLTLVMVLLTYSTASFAILALNFGLLLIENRKERKCKVNQKELRRAIVVLLAGILVVAVAMQSANIRSMADYQFSKILGYLTNGKKGKLLWTSSDRLNQLALAWDYFRSGNLMQLLFGRGTGAYAAYVSSLPREVAMTTAEEAYNIYLSTLADRGILGLLLVLFVLFEIIRLKPNSLGQKTLVWGVLVHFLCWMLMGNFWLYTCWSLLGICLCYKKETIR